MPTLATAEEKYQRNASRAGARWKAGVEAGDYCAGIAQFLGHAVPGCVDRQANWSEALGAVSAAEWQADVSVAGPRWAAGYESAFTGAGAVRKPRKGRAGEEY